MAQFSKALFSHPFSRAYWKASAETRRVRILAARRAVHGFKNGDRFVPDSRRR